MTKFIITTEDLNEELGKINKTYAFVQINSLPHVLDISSPDSVKAYSDKMFKVLMNSKKVSISGEKTRLLAEIWLEWEGKRIFKGGVIPEMNDRSKMLYVNTKSGEVLIHEIDNWIVQQIQSGWFTSKGNMIEFKDLKANFLEHSKTSNCSINALTRSLEKFCFLRWNSNSTWKMIVPDIETLNISLAKFLDNSGITDQDILSLRKKTDQEEIQDLRAVVLALQAQVQEEIQAREIRQTTTDIMQESITKHQLTEALKNKEIQKLILAIVN